MDTETIQKDTAWVKGLSEVLAEAHNRFIEKKIRKNSSRSSNWPSSLGHPCELNLAFWRTQGEKATGTPIGLQRIFEEGNKQEDLILRQLEDMGVRVLERGVSFGSDAMFRELNIHGQLDAKLDFSGIDADLLSLLQTHFPDVNWKQKRVVAECKSLSPYIFDKLTDYDSLMTHKSFYVRGWADQIQLYLLGSNQEAGLFIFKNKSSGELRFIPILLDLEECDRLALKAKRVNAAVAKYEKDGSLPAPIAWRQDVCAECPFLAICPNSREIPPTEISTDSELIELLGRREALKTAITEADEIKERIDDKLEPFQGTNVLVGDFQVRWSKIERPEKVTPASSYFMKRITKLPGTNGVAK